MRQSPSSPAASQRRTRLLSLSGVRSRWHSICFQWFTAVNSTPLLSLLRCEGGDGRGRSAGAGVPLIIGHGIRSELKMEIGGEGRIEVAAPSLIVLMGLRPTSSETAA